MLNQIKFIISIFLLGFIIFTCKNNELDYRNELVGTYIVVCTQQQTYPFNPTIIYPIDTTDIGKEIEVTFDPDDELDELDKGTINIDGSTFPISLYANGNGYSFSSPWISHGQGRSNGGRFISPDSIIRVWDSPASPSAEYRYECRGSKVQ